MRTFCFQQQFSYSNGGMMCTTACMQVGMAMLCGQINLNSASLESDDERSSILRSIQWCMDAGNIVHGRVERMLFARENSCNNGIVGVCGGLISSSSRMVSVNELVSLLRIDLSGIGVQCEELVVVPSHRSTAEIRPRDRQEPAAALSAPKNQASSCLISMDQLPMCMEMPPSFSFAQALQTFQPSNSMEGVSEGSLVVQQQPPAPVCVAIATGNGHTVCLACYRQDRYAFFDSGPGHFVVGLTGQQALARLHGALGIRVADCYAADPCINGSAPKRQKKNKKNDKGSKNKWGGGGERDEEEQNRSFAEHEDLVSLCDITLLYLSSEKKKASSEKT